MKQALNLPAHGFRVRFKTELCDAQGRVERVLSEGHNTITDWGMDALATNRINAFLTHLHVSDTADARKRIGDGINELTVTVTDASDVDLATASNFFEAGDVGRTFKIDGWPELVIDGFTDEQNVHAHARNDEWLPGFTPPGSGPFLDFGVHYTNTATLANQVTTINTFDTGAANNNTELNDSANSRWIHQRIWLGPTQGSTLTANQLGWGQGGANCFGIANLGAPDVIPAGKKYRVTLQVFSGYDPVDITGFSADWGATIGTHDIDIRQERIHKDSGSRSFLMPFIPLLTGGDIFRWGWQDSAATMQATLWEGDPGFGTTRPNAVSSVIENFSGLNGTYTAGTHRRDRSVRWKDDLDIINATALWFGYANSDRTAFLTIIPDGTTITKPSGYILGLTFGIYWTRELLN